MSSKKETHISTRHVLVEKKPFKILQCNMVGFYLVTNYCWSDYYVITEGFNIGCVISKKDCVKFKE